MFVMNEILNTDLKGLSYQAPTYLCSVIFG